MSKLSNLLTNLFNWISRIFSVKDLESPKDKSKTKTDGTKTPTKDESPMGTKIPSKPTSTTTTDTTSGGKTGTSTSSGAVTIDPDYNNREGYNEAFLSVKIPLPKIAKESQPKIVTTTEGGKKELKYHHYSVVMNGERKMPFFTAVNIDGASYERLGDVPSRTEIGRDKWYVDPRIPKDKQLLAAWYGKNDFDIGHQVRREDALWGDTLEIAIKANNDTFHLTNAAPQHKDLNRSAERWLGLESYALKNCRKYGLKISVFTGPIFAETDGTFNGVKIPDKFWKIITMIKDDGKPSSTGYIVHQNDLIDDIVTRSFVYEQFKTYQVPISEIENLTNINFGLNAYDPLQKTKHGLAYIFEPKPVDSFDDIVF